VENLQRISGVEVDFRRQGTVVLGEDAAPVGCRRLPNEELLRLEPALQPQGYPAFFVEEDSVDPLPLMRAAVRAAELSGVEIRSGVAVQRMRCSGLEVEVETDGALFKAKAAVNCLGAWSGAPVRPRKGQMLYVQPSRMGLLPHVVRAPGAYIVPRSSGKILIGTTVEDVGFDKSVNQETIRAMHVAAARYVPELQSASVVDSWAGLRPGSPDDLPLIGATDTRGIFLASGLFRNGILLAPITGRIMADLVMGRPAEIEISAFSPARFAAAKA
jgi:glycine oxidase